jgi:hypothetical protein
MNFIFNGHHALRLQHFTLWQYCHFHIINITYIYMSIQHASFFIHLKTRKCTVYIAIWISLGINGTTAQNQLSQANCLLLHTWMYTCMYVCIYGCMYACTYNMYACMCTYVQKCTNVFTWENSSYHAYIPAYTYRSTHHYHFNVHTRVRAASQTSRF